MRELSAVWGVSSDSNVGYVLGSLERLEWITSGPHKRARTLELTREGRRQLIEYIRWQINHASGGIERTAA